jgi:hypothetical protein
MILNNSSNLNIICAHCKPKLVFTELILQILYWIYEIAIHSNIFFIGFAYKYRVMKYIFLREIGLFLVCLTVEKNVGMTENHRFMIDYEYHEKRR